MLDVSLSDSNIVTSYLVAPIRSETAFRVWTGTNKGTAEFGLAVTGLTLKN